MVKPRLRPLKGGFWYAYGDGVRATGIGIIGAYREWVLGHLNERSIRQRWERRGRR